MLNREGFSIGIWAYRIARKIEEACSRLVLQEQDLKLDFTHPGNSYL